MTAPDNRPPLKIMYVSAEVSPFAKVGGLADVAASLPKALAAMGHDARVVTPDHGGRLAAAGAVVATSFDVAFLGRDERVVVLAGELAPGAPVYFIGNATYFSGERVYGAPDDLLRYHFFCRAVLELPKALDWRPDVINCNDWHTALVPFGLRNRAWNDPFYQGAASALTIHNLGYRGPDDASDVLSQGIYYAGVVNTVSPTYAREITTPEFGQGLHTLLQLRGDRLYGIVNGLDLDLDLFNPEPDPAIGAHYSAAAPGGKVANKAALQQSLGLKVNPAAPLAGMVSRLDYQKGVELVLDSMERAVTELGMQFVVLGSGDPKYQQRLQELAARWPGSVHAEFGFAAALAQQIYAGADLFLMPSRYEPCGLGHLISMRYGAVPVVRRTRGLADTVQDAAPGLGSGTGFVFDDFETEAMYATLQRAAGAFKDRDHWMALVRRGMEQDFSWGAPAQRYEEMYRVALAN